MKEVLLTNTNNVIVYVHYNQYFHYLMTLCYTRFLLEHHAVEEVYVTIFCSSDFKYLSIRINTMVNPFTTGNTL